jgi:hypothetical protein
VDISDTRDAIAAALSELEDITVRPRTLVRSPRIGEGWVTLGNISPSTFLTGLTVNFRVIIVLGADLDAAETRYEELAPDVIEAITQIDDVQTSDVEIEPVSLAVEGSATNAITLTLTTEVDV